jgi:cyclopropane-fatty-acyl-phospholipid synthase
MGTDDTIAHPWVSGGDGDDTERMKDVVRENFERSVDAYREYERRTGNFAALARRLRDAMATAHDGAVERVLDAGAGTGASTDVFRELGETVALDASHRMVSENDAPVRVVGDFDRLPFRDATFDAVAFTASLFLVSDPSPAVAEARRVLREGGVVGVVAPLGWVTPDGDDVFDSLARDSRSPASVRTVEEAVGAEFAVETGEWAFETTAEALRAFHAVPAMAARLFPRLDPDDRVRETRALLADVEGPLEQRWRWMVGRV